MEKTQLFSVEQIKEINKKLAVQIARDYKGKNPIFVGVLNEVYIFMADLTRAVWQEGLDDFEIDFVGITSYGTNLSSSKKPKFTKELSLNIEGRHVIVVEDVIETGHTLYALVNSLKEKKPLSIKTVVLLAKKRDRDVEFTPEYVGAEVSSEFWVEGYGFDSGYKGRGRSEIVKYKPSK